MYEKELGIDKVIIKYQVLIIYRKLLNKIIKKTLIIIKRISIIKSTILRNYLILLYKQKIFNYFLPIHRYFHPHSPRLINHHQFHYFDFH